MKTNTTTEEIKLITEALAKMHVYPFRLESSDPKYNAQRNLSGKTHYVDDDTLRFHKSRVLSARELHGGLLFRIVCSDALDMHNTRRGCRAVVFDVFGDMIWRVELEESSRTKQQALNECEKQTIDLVEHYRKAIEDQARRLEDSGQNMKLALDALQRKEAAA